MKIIFYSYLTVVLPTGVLTLGTIPLLEKNNFHCFLNLQIMIYFWSLRSNSFSPILTPNSALIANVSGKNWKFLPLPFMWLKPPPSRSRAKKRKGTAYREISPPPVQEFVTGEDGVPIMFIRSTTCVLVPASIEQGVEVTNSPEPSWKSYHKRIPFQQVGSQWSMYFAIIYIHKW